MSTIKSVNKKMKQIKVDRKTDKNLKNMQDFYEQMKDLGIAQKKQYNLPPLSMINLTGSKHR